MIERGTFLSAIVAQNASVSRHQGSWCEYLIPQSYYIYNLPANHSEHLKRVHSLRVPCCVTCKQRFHGRTRAHAEEARRLHESTGQCQNRELTLSEPEWMTEEQDTRFASSMIQGHSSSPEEKWQSLYRQLFDVQNDSDIPHPCAFQISHMPFSNGVLTSTDYDYLVPGRDSATAPDAEVGQTLPLTAHPAQGFLSEPSSLITTPLCQEGNAVSSSQLLSHLPLEVSLSETSGETYRMMKTNICFQGTQQCRPTVRYLATASRQLRADLITAPRWAEYIHASQRLC